MSNEHKESLLGTRTICQIAVVVHDIEKSSRAYAAVFGLEVPDWFMTQPGTPGTNRFG